MKKEIGYIGLGRMGKNMVSRLLDAGWSIVAYDKSVESVQEVVSMGGVGAGSLAEVVSKLPIPRTIWIMVPHQVVEEVINELVPLLTKGDLIIDGGNSPYRESIRRSKELETKGINFLDIGVSGGPGGSRSGACMMVGGKAELYDKLDAVGFFKDTCLGSGWGYFGVSGAGHFVKMVHNGIEYGMMQSIAEGFDLMRHSKEFDLDLEKITEVYSHGSVVTSSLVSWMHDGYKKYGKDLNQISGRASASGEGKWTVEAGKRENISMPAIQTAVDVREKSQKKPSYQGKVISTMRGEFGQHSVKKGDDEPEIL
ncbi:6-phosphogluconate dehydrogenase (decarboxylating) [Candidatus Nomurabacteria bacterium RIFCSPLOWO2_02_40_28]|uniref:6-phosphogluconate dehydrogenase, decarboxylating n=2 Tax=Candidatus Nomuraibacteriota TaxID=1752729 RepID=A0A837HUD6_9BACT|nr:MAG: 6-phosphogluconate dehydrogenase, decarboxylating [Candidatus Nomurabacteria bacterium GW2011_GWD2_39_12]KKR20665.1 MAG: 6-phosphogluconate dehydrogenase, decarboxylating [Candidatus Nomurabacteria bacterium GW2011_GWC2_39_41]KKR37406.1 MAG: 6-phosphogluconate dehydrogenase, decarboxylating [Candidatus Nomurabacteria bacterium GW2011_GWE2_40_10]KKR38654.1 MAG: 6-phosphogluconate dehydrogenase, decarboxylating [Candidatus Nomurabacteria bacterium GW2011_GWB1_40_11]KKR40379.1 MAG: 6-phosp